MLTEPHIALFLLTCLAFFTTINLHNILIFHKRRNNQPSEAKVERPSDSAVALAALGTGTYFFEVSLYIFLVLTNLVSITTFSLTLQLPYQLHCQILGLAFTSAGYFLFLWSVLVRGRYATSWSMRPNHKLITTGPYHYVRHPSYLGYFLMFIGLPLLIPNLLTLIPLIAIPGYYHVTFHEEKLLLAHFGDEYREYQKKTGRFLPKL